MISKKLAKTSDLKKEGLQVLAIALISLLFIVAPAYFVLAEPDSSSGECTYGGWAWGAGLFDNVGSYPGDRQAVSGDCCGDDASEVFKNLTGTADDACCQYASNCASYTPDGRCYRSNVPSSGGDGGPTLCYNGAWNTCNSGKECVSGGTNWKCTYDGSSWGWYSTSSMPSEVCDAYDNDCDGSYNEGLSQSCGTTSVGACTFGTETCDVYGGWVGCTAVFPTTEQCDGTDQDCDNVLDGSEGLTQTCGTTDVGPCTYGTESCTNAGGWTGCDAVFPSSEQCDGVDNNCDGSLNYNAYENTYSTGTETCDGEDNDCDGSIDEGMGYDSCSFNCVYGGDVWGAGLFDNVGSYPGDRQAVSGDCCGDDASEVFKNLTGTADDACCQYASNCASYTPDGRCYRSNVPSSGGDGGTSLCYSGSWSTCSDASHTACQAVGDWKCTKPVGGSWGWYSVSSMPADGCDSVDNDCDGSTDEEAAYDSCEYACLNNVYGGGAVWGDGLFTPAGPSQATQDDCCGDDASESFHDFADNNRDACCQQSTDCVDYSTPGKCYSSDTTTSGGDGGTSLCYNSGWSTCTDASHTECYSPAGSSWKCTKPVGGSWGWYSVSSMPADGCDSVDNDCNGVTDDGVAYDSCEYSCLNNVYGGVWGAGLFDNVGSYPGDRQAVSGDCCGDDANEVFKNLTGIADDACCQYASDCASYSPDGRCYVSNVPSSGGDGGPTLCYSGSWNTCSNSNHVECQQIGDWKCTTPDNSSGTGWGWYQTTSMPAEVCDSVDNDCDGTRNEGFTIETCDWECLTFATPAYGGPGFDTVYDLFSPVGPSQATNDDCCGNNAYEFFSDNFMNNNYDACCQDQFDCVATDPAGACYASNTINPNTGKLCRVGGSAAWITCGSGNACVTHGSWQCSTPDGVSWIWYYPSNLPEEVCDTADNNCDGSYNEGLFDCTCEGGGSPSAEEVCGDGIDNNCNTIIDENDCVSEPCVPSSERYKDCQAFDYEAYDYKVFINYDDEECPFEYKDYLKNHKCAVTSPYIDNYYKYNEMSTVSESIQHFKLKNKFFNGDFTQGLANWEAYGSGGATAPTVDVIVSDSMFGNISVEVTGSTTSTGEYAGIRSTFDVKPSTDYTASAYLKASGDKPNIGIHCFSEADSNIDHRTIGSQVVTISGTDWERVYVQFQTDAVATVCRVNIYLSHGESGSFKVDGVQVEEFDTYTGFGSGMYSVKYAYDHKNRLISQLNSGGVGESHSFDFLNNDRFTGINNLIPDPSFELYEGNELFYWDGGSVSLTSNAKTGSKAITTSVNYATKTVNELLPVFSGKIYTMATYAKKSSTDTSLGFKLNFYDKDKNKLDPTTFNIDYGGDTWTDGCGGNCKYKSLSVTSSSYIRLSRSFKVPANAEYIELSVGRAGSGGAIIIDDVSLNQDTSAAPFKMLEYEYNPDATIETVTYDDGLAVAKFDYYPRNWIKSLDTNMGGSSIFNESYEYDDSGNLINISYPWGNSTKLYYDSLQRLTDVLNYGYYLDEGDITFTYDAAGNRLSKSDKTYDYFNRNVNNRLESDKVFEYTYDGAGRISSRTFVGDGSELDYFQYTRSFGGTDIFIGTQTFEYYTDGNLRNITLQTGEYIRYYYNPSDNSLAVRETPYSMAYYITNRFGQLVYQTIPESFNYTPIIACREIEQNFNDAGKKLIIKQGSEVLAVFDDQGYLKIKGIFNLSSDFTFERAFGLQDSTGWKWAIDNNGNMHFISGLELLKEKVPSVSLGEKNLILQTGGSAIAGVNNTGTLQLKKCVATEQDLSGY
ncbi:MAG: carbohydrate binding domain-containing protein [DPANN group archaeon]|nr:carbohydrate binding domain-containing protein [DPANN group archaeon]